MGNYTVLQKLLTNLVLEQDFRHDIMLIPTWKKQYCNNDIYRLVKKTHRYTTTFPRKTKN